MRGTRDTIVAGHATLALDALDAIDAARTVATTAHVAVNRAGSPCAVVRPTAASGNPRCAPSVERTIGVSIEEVP
ncbi:hypothetical protein [Burkholderia sp. IMCC1007]|uniref:hypothetical protein n=1 Tax=Burkholderia sp. IMCC1007 TaxID=3004104 RepID=UPI0022B2FA48|nr:hypothetical protein [Burkholderia sp. IMCC1007]